MRFLAVPLENSSRVLLCAGLFGTRVGGKARNRILEEATAATLRTREANYKRKETANALRCEVDAPCLERSEVGFSKILPVALKKILVPLFAGRALAAGLGRDYSRSKTWQIVVKPDKSRDDVSRSFKKVVAL